MTSPTPVFPLSHVVFPGVNVPLHVFEERYRTLVEDMMAISDPAERLFGTVAIREGFEVGDRHTQSLYRVGTMLQVTEAVHNADGSWEILAVGRSRFQVDDMLPDAGSYPRAHVTPIAESADPVSEEQTIRARAVFESFREAVAELRDDPFSGTLPRDPEYLSWTLSAIAPLPLAEKQSLLAASGAAERLESVTSMLREELRAMNAIPSLPATEVSRTSWCPN